MVIRLDGFDRAFADDGALSEHRHDLGNLPDKVHIMLDHDDRLLLRQGRQQAPGLLRFFIAHPGHRLIDQEQRGLLQNHHADLQPLLLAVRQGPGAIMRMVR